MSAAAATAGRRFADRLPRGARAVAWLGIALGLLAFWLALPPLATRTVWVPIFVGIVGVFCGIAAVTRDVRRLGWSAVAIGLLGIGLGYLATRSSVGNLEAAVGWSGLLAAMLRYATPITFAAIGGMFSERSGVANIGLEGMMLSGAFFAIMGADKTGNWFLGLLIGMLSGAALALIHAFFSIHLRSDQIVSGTAINFLALGITGYLFIDVYGDQGTPADVPEIPDVHLGPVKDIPFLGEIFGQLNLMVWLMFASLVVSYLVLFRTPIGLRIRAVGEHPRAADTVGISVYRVRYAAVIVSGVLASMGGAYLTIGFVHTFTENMTTGRGFIGLAAMIFGNWRPAGLFAAALLFGFSSAIAQRLQVYSQSAATLFETLPYVLTLIAVAGVIGRSIPPAAIARPYEK